MVEIIRLECTGEIAAHIMRATARRHRINCKVTCRGNRVLFSGDEKEVATLKEMYYKIWDEGNHIINAS